MLFFLYIYSASNISHTQRKKIYELFTDDDITISTTLCVSCTDLEMSNKDFFKISLAYKVSRNQMISSSQCILYECDSVSL